MTAVLRPDDDPTGVAALLRALPEPGPMPEAVAERIRAALAAEPMLGSASPSFARSSADPTSPSPSDSPSDSDGGSATDPFGLFASDSPRAEAAAGAHHGPTGGQLAGAGSDRRAGGIGDAGDDLDPRAAENAGEPGRDGDIGAGARVVRLRPTSTRRWASLGAAAAAVAAIALGIGALKGGVGAGGSASMADRAATAVTPAGGAPAAAPQPAAEKAGEAAGPADGNDSDASPTELWDNPEQRRSLGASGREYHADTLAAQAQGLLDSSAPATQLHLDPASPSTWGSVAAPGGLLSCERTLGVSDADVVAGDLATFEGQPVLVLVVVDDSGKEVYVVSRSCSKGDPGLVWGPVPMT